jgi:hypothetical protein
MTFDNRFFVIFIGVFFVVSVVCLLVSFFSSDKDRSHHVLSFGSIAGLLFLCTLFSQDVAASWLSSIALLAFSFSEFLLLVVVPHFSNERLRDFFAVLRSAFVVVRMVAFVNLCIMVALSCYERVFPYYFSFVR